MSSNPDFQILNDTHKSAIDQALDMIIKLRAEMLKAGQAGIDMKAQLADLDAKEDSLKRIRKVYFPTNRR